MSSSFERNDRKRTSRDRRPPLTRGRPGPARARPDSDPDEWLWGWHPVLAALANPRREKPKKLLATAERAKKMTEHFGPLPALQIAETAEIAVHLPQGAVHQGVALRSAALEPLALEEIGERPSGFLLMLDQVTDPQNVGAIFRSAAAFGARGVILQDRHAPHLAGALAKAAAGAVDFLPHARVTNLSRALETLEQLGWRAVGLAGEAEEALSAVLDARPTVLVLGSEGEGIRRLVREHCDALGKIPMPGGFESLNVSAAAAIALYEVAGKAGTQGVGGAPDPA